MPGAQITKALHQNGSTQQVRQLRHTLSIFERIIKAPGKGFGDEQSKNSYYWIYGWHNYGHSR